MASRFSINDINKLPEKTLFFDANVLVYVFFPIYSHNKKRLIRGYSNLYQKLINKSIELAIDLTVLSEVVNTVLRYDYNNQKNSGTFNSFKDYRNSPPGRTYYATTTSIIKRHILPNFHILNSDLTKSEIGGIFTNNSVDFNDGIIMVQSQKHDCILVTHDSDFSGTDIDILTANNILLEN
jgi:predicted nucleic acid-binding protein